MSIDVVFLRRNRIFENAKRLRDEVERTLEKEVGPHYIKEFEKVTSDWQHKPDWKQQLKSKRATSELTVYPSGKNAKIWAWVSRGTKAHRIAARRAPLLAFRTNYSARTQPVGRYSVGSGRATGPLVFARTVNHPGNKARKFEEVISKKQSPWFYKTMDKAFKRGVKMMQR